MFELVSQYKPNGDQPEAIQKQEDKKIKKCILLHFIYQF